jgi:hypothetical protein
VCGLCCEAMTSSQIDLNLPEGWSCWVELQQTLEGAYFGKAELRQGYTQRCVLVIAQQLTREAVLERLKCRAEHFILEWNSRPPP